MPKRVVPYTEGQWFAVPLHGGGYAIGVIVRGDYKTSGGLGYFFGPRMREVPGEQAVIDKQAADACLIAWFGDLALVEGRWPLIPSHRPFRREEWPVPRFGQPHATEPTKGWISEYDQNTSGFSLPVRRRITSIEEARALPRDGVFMANAIENELSKLLPGDRQT